MAIGKREQTRAKEIDEATRLLRQRDYGRLLSILVERIYSIELCKHGFFGACRECFAEIEGDGFLGVSEDL